MKLFELATKIKIEKAGIIPYVFNKDGQLEMLFMIPSLAMYGGPDPQIAKGNVDPGETLIEAAIREGKEELGLRKKNFAHDPIHVWTGSFKSTEAYDLHVYACEVVSKHDFGVPHFETKKTLWLTPMVFEVKGAQRQKNAVKFAAEEILKFKLS